MVASFTMPNGEPQQTGEPTCTIIGEMPDDTDKDARCLGKILKLYRLGLVDTEIDTISVRVATGTQETTTTHCLGYDDGVENVLITHDCPSDTAQRCGALCIQNVLEGITNPTDISEPTTKIKPSKTRKVTRSRRIQCIGFGQGESAVILKKKY